MRQDPKIMEQRLGWLISEMNDHSVEDMKTAREWTELVDKKHNYKNLKWGGWHTNTPFSTNVATNTQYLAILCALGFIRKTMTIKVGGRQKIYKYQRITKIPWNPIPVVNITHQKVPNETVSVL